MAVAMLVQDGFPDILYSMVICMEVSFQFAFRAFACHEKRWGLDVIKVLQKLGKMIMGYHH